MTKTSNISVDREALSFKILSNLKTIGVEKNIKL